VPAQFVIVKAPSDEVPDPSDELRECLYQLSQAIFYGDLLRNFIFTLRLVCGFWYASGAFESQSFGKLLKEKH
jgi:hypothetical protein